MRRFTGLASGPLALVLAVALGACTSGGGAKTSSSTTGSVSGSTSTSTGSGTATVPSDMLAYDPAEVASATSRSFLGNQAAAKLSIVGVRSAGGGTVLTFWVTTAQSYKSPLASARPENWPRLVDVAGKKAYGVNTFASVERITYCVCTDNASVDPTRRVLTAEYPPLPAALGSVSVQLPGFPAVTVPVTR